MDKSDVKSVHQQRITTHGDIIVADTTQRWDAHKGVTGIRSNVYHVRAQRNNDRSIDVKCDGHILYRHLFCCCKECFHEKFDQRTYLSTTGVFKEHPISHILRSADETKENIDAEEDAEPEVDMG